MHRKGKISCNVFLCEVISYRFVHTSINAELAYIEQERCLYVNQICT